MQLFNDTFRKTLSQNWLSNKR